MGVVGAKGAVKGSREVGTASLLAAPEVDKLIVLWPKVRMVWINQGCKVGDMLCFELLVPQQNLWVTLGAGRSPSA